ncbi:MAG: hypothetical protein J6Z16_02460 [Candidatus Methanomethylophilaceae archaeon]|nr:hypothetical protein [Candidatus Methanomethylophilaceae archaeon]
MSAALKKMSMGMGLGLLGGILAIAAVAYSWDGSFQSIVPVGLNLLIATMFFATAGSFAKSAPVAGKSIAIIAAVCVAMTIVSMAYASTFLWLQIILLAIGVAEVLLGACPAVIRYADTNRSA